MDGIVGLDPVHSPSNQLFIQTEWLFERCHKGGHMQRRNVINMMLDKNGEAIQLVRAFVCGLAPGLIKKTKREGIVAFSAEERENIVAYFRAESYMLRELMDNPGTYRMPEYIYRGTVAGWIDDHLSQSPSGQALRNRIKAVIDGTEKVVFDKLKNSHGRVRIVNLGCGTGRDTLEMIRKNSRWNGSVHVECIDLDREAIESGREFARNSEVPGIDFIESNILSLPYREEFDIGLLVGVLCGVPATRCVAILKRIRPYLKRGGFLIASNVMNTMAEEDPFVSYILDEFVGWKLVYKTQQQLQHIFERAGYEWKGCFYDEPHHFHCMGIGIVR